MSVTTGAVDSSYTVGAAVLLGWGLLDCFFGYRIFRVAVALLGALVLGVFIGGLGAQVFGGGEAAYWIAFAFGALLGLVLSFAFYLIGVFLAGFSLGYALALALVPLTGPTATLLIGAVAGVACGLLALLLQRLLVSAATAFSGALRVALAAAFFFEGMDWQFYLRRPDQVPALMVGRWWITAIVLGLGLIGFFTQLRSTPVQKPKKAD